MKRTPKLQAKPQYKEAAEVVRESEVRFRALVSATSDVIYRMSPDWKEMRQLDGRGFLSDTGKPDRKWLKKYIHPKDQKHVKQVINDAIRTKSIFELEHQVLRADGTLGWTFSRAIPILDKHGEIVEWFGAASDVTQQKQMQEQIKISEVRYRTMIEQSPLSTQILSPDGKTLMVNTAWEKLWGAKLEHLKDYNMLKDKQLVELGIMPYIKKGFKGEPTHIPAVKYYPSKTIPDITKVSYRWVSAIIYPVKDDQGKIQEIVLVHQDITEQKDAAEKVQQSEQQLQAIMDESPAVIFIKDSEGRYLLINRQYETLFKVTRKEIKGKTDYDLFPKETADQVTQNDKKVLQSKTL